MTSFRFILPANNDERKAPAVAARPAGKIGVALELALKPASCRRHPGQIHPMFKKVLRNEHDENRTRRRRHVCGKDPAKLEWKAVQPHCKNPVACRPMFFCGEGHGVFGAAAVGGEPSFECFKAERKPFARLSQRAADRAAFAARTVGEFYNRVSELRLRQRTLQSSFRRFRLLHSNRRNRKPFCQLSGSRVADLGGMA